MPTGGRAPRKGWQERFLKAFRETHMVTEACKKAGCSRAFVYDYRKRDSAFAQAWADIEEQSTEILEQVATRRAIEGSDNLIMFLLKSRRPEVYRENVYHEHTHQVGGEVEILLNGQQPIQIEAAKRREAARLLLAGPQGEAPVDAEVVETTASAAG